MSRNKKRWVRCMARTADGSQCGRSAPRDTQLCHIHARQLSGAPPSGQPFTRTLTWSDRLEKIASDDKHPQQLQAIRMLLEQSRISVGDITNDGFSAWPLEPSEILDRIDKDWRQLGTSPQLGDIDGWISLVGESQEQTSPEK